MGRTSRTVATVESAIDDAIPPVSEGNGSSTGRGQTLSSLDKDTRNGIYMMAGEQLNSVLTALSQAFPDVLVGELASVLHIKAGEKNFSVSVNPVLRSLCEYMGTEPGAFLNEVAQISNVPRRYLGVQEVENGQIFKINNIFSSPDTISTLAASVRKEYSTVIAEPGYQEVRDRQRAQGQERANRRQQELVY